MKNVMISLVIVNYNTKTFLKNCLSSIEREVGVSILPEIIVFDNNSSDGSQTFIRNNYPKVKLIESKQNLGFGGANNRAAKVARGEYLFFLNPDTKLDKHCLSRLLAFAKKLPNKDFILISKQMTYDDKHFLQLGLASDIFGFPNSAYDANGSRQIRHIFYADGAALFIPKRTFEKLGGFDEEMFMYQEDIDLSWKAHLMKIKLYPVSEAIVFHKAGAVSGGGISRGNSYKTTFFRRYYAERNLLRNLLKNYSWWNLLWVLPLNFFINLGEFALFLLLLQPKVASIYLKAYWWNIANIKSTLKKRRWIQKKRKVPDKNILRRMNKAPSKLYLLKRVGVPIIK